MAHNRQKGQIALTGVLIILAVSLVVAVNAGLLGIGELDIGLRDSQSIRSFNVAEACLEEALIRLRQDPNYSGGSLNFLTASCTIEVRVTGANTREVGVIAQAAGQFRKAKAVVNIFNDHIEVEQWQEVP